MSHSSLSIRLSFFFITEPMRIGDDNYNNYGTGVNCARTCLHINTSTAKYCTMRHSVCIALIMNYLSLGAQAWHALTRDDTFIHKWNEPYLPLTPRCRASLHFGWYSFPILIMVGA